MDPKVREVTEKVRERSEIAQALLGEVRKVIVGQEHLVESLLVSLFAGGHILLEGVPGLAKTMAIKTLAESVEMSFSRIQFTPDLLPSDLVGTRVFDPRDVAFRTEKGPVFAHFLLADEINRSPAKVQSALLEAMEEQQVTIEKETFPLPEPFLVMATQNPIETEGTYPLSEAQVDRFMFKVELGYPSLEEEKVIVQRMAVDKGLRESIAVQRICGPAEILSARELIQQIYVDENVINYAAQLVDATRNPQRYNLDIGPFIRYGGSPRATLYLIVAGRTKAFLRRRGFVTPEDIKSVAADVLRHRIILSYEAEAEDLTSGMIIDRVLQAVPVP